MKIDNNDEFWQTPMDFLINELIPVANKTLESLREQKLIGKNRDAKLIIYSGAQSYYNYDFFRLWSIQYFGGIRELTKVSSVEVRLDETISPPMYFRLEAESILGNLEHNQCPRCQNFHKKERKTNWYLNEKRLCKSCYDALGEEFFLTRAQDYDLLAR